MDLQYYAQCRATFYTGRNYDHDQSLTLNHTTVGPRRSSCAGWTERLVYMASQPNDNTAAVATSADIAPALVNCVELEALLLRESSGEAVAVGFSRHASFPSRVDWLWQHASIVHKPGALGVYCLISKEKRSIYWYVEQ